MRAENLADHYSLRVSIQQHDMMISLLLAMTTGHWGNCAWSACIRTRPIPLARHRVRQGYARGLPVGKFTSFQHFQRGYEMDIGIEGKTALVLGAGGGLGSAIAKTLANEGAQVALADIDADAVDRVVAEIRQAGGSAMAVPFDLADRSAMHAQVTAVEAAFGTVDILVNNTGGPPPTPATGQDPALWRKSFEQMVLPVITLTDRVLPAMRAHKWGRIITSTSSGVVASIPNLGTSNALRLSLVGWSKTLAREVGRDGVTANIVLPGRVATGRIRFLDEQKAKRENRSVDDVSAESTATIPVGRYGEPQEYADVVVFLASERASYVNGSVIRVDGGLIASI
jgi:3-oxoacyl-[acyl-carrier protein] reductase